MTKHRIVTFTDGIAWVEITNDLHQFLALEDNKTLFINPDLSNVRGVPPDFWTVKDGKIVALEGKELEDRVNTNNPYALSNNAVICDILEQIKESTELTDKLEQKTATDLFNLEQSINSLEQKTIDSGVNLEQGINSLEQKTLESLFNLERAINSVEQKAVETFLNLEQKVNNNNINISNNLSTEIINLRQHLDKYQKLNDCVHQDLKLHINSNDMDIKNTISELTNKFNIDIIKLVTNLEQKDKDIKLINKKFTIACSIITLIFIALLTIT